MCFRSLFTLQLVTQLKSFWVYFKIQGVKRILNIILAKSHQEKN